MDNYLNNKSWNWWPLFPLYPYGKKKTILREIIPNEIWSLEQIQGLYYVAVPIRMTIIKVNNGLMLINPLPPTKELVNALEELISIYGKVTDVPWSVTFVQVDNLPRHPTQIYEALLEGIILILILINFKNKNFLLKPGLISSLFLIFYSIFRFSIEFLRVPDEQLGYLLFNLTMGQILSVILTLAGLVLFYFKNEDKQIN